MRKTTGHLAGNDSKIAFCRMVDPVLMAELQQLAKDKANEQDAANKRKSDAAAAVSTIASTASTAAAGKRSRPSCSASPDVGTKGIAAAFFKAGEMGADANAPMTIADMNHGEGLPGDFAQMPKVIEAMKAQRPRRTSPLTEDKSMELSKTHSQKCTLHAGKQISKYKEDFSLAAVSDRATVHHILLINVLAT